MFGKATNTLFGSYPSCAGFSEGEERHGIALRKHIEALLAASDISGNSSNGTRGVKYERRNEFSPGHH